MAKALLWWTMLLGLALAQNDQSLPKHWGELVSLLFSGAVGIPLLVQALRKGVHWPELFRSKTVYTALSGFVTALGLFFSGTIGVPGLIGAFYLMLVAVFLRDALGKDKTPPSQNPNSPLEP